jgi:hypothetical protein
MGTKFSKNEKILWLCILFPVFWIFLPFVIARIIADGIRSWWYERQEERR